jgi:hypothetical protein
MVSAPSTAGADTMSDNKPAAQVRLYPITAAIWKNATAKGGAFYSVTFSRSYKDAEGKYKEADSYSGSDLLLLAKVADLAHSKVEELRKTDGQADEGAA